ncbi:protein tolkin-like [Argopecten irradians]|uniref:protein tolkin-like n=1 Tax=Argopecten irradians TaxID=31199 RepID=UPI00371EE2DE
MITADTVIPPDLTYSGPSHPGMVVSNGIISPESMAKCFEDMNSINPGVTTETVRDEDADNDDSDDDGDDYDDEDENSSESVDKDTRGIMKLLKRIMTTQRRGTAIRDILAKRITMTQTDRIWPQAVVPYTFGSLAPSKTEDIKQAFQIFHKYSCVRFYEWHDKLSTELSLQHQNYLEFFSGSGCSSVVGMSPNNKPQKISCCGAGVCVHELGHALGFIHEQQNPLRDDYIRVNLESVKTTLKCPDDTRMCENDGYLTYQDNQCICRCIHGLDPVTNCVSLLQQNQRLYTSDWPAVKFALLKAKDVPCPEESVEGTLTHFGLSSWTANRHDADGAVTKTYTTMKFCTFSNLQRSGETLTFSPGQYCINRVEGLCPDDAISLGTQYFGFKNPKGSSIADVQEPVPLSYHTDITNVWLYYCVYQPITKGCGAIIELTDDAPTSVIQSPNYPDPYNQYSECTWVVRSPANSSVVLDFSDFIIPNGGSTTSCEEDELEIRFNLPGQPGLSDFYDGLDENYCRTPGPGLRPFCYTAAEGCVPNYCDVCGVGSCFDINADCFERFKDDNSYCSDNKHIGPDGTIGCAATCDMCGRRIEERGCPTDWILLNGVCYKYFPTFETWLEANQTCAMFEGGTLFITEDIDLVYEVMNPNKVVVWIGLSDITKEGTFMWNDNTPLDTTKLGASWKPGQPNDNDGQEDCVEVNKSKKLLDQNCDVRTRPYVCQAPLKVPTVCKDARSDCEPIQEDFPEMCNEHKLFAELACRVTCGICEPSKEPCAT